MQIPSQSNSFKYGALVHQPKAVQKSMTFGHRCLWVVHIHVLHVDWKVDGFFASIVNCYAFVGMVTLRPPKWLTSTKCTYLCQ